MCMVVYLQPSSIYRTLYTLEWSVFYINRSIATVGIFPKYFGKKNGHLQQWFAVFWECLFPWNSLSLNLDMHWKAENKIDHNWYNICYNCSIGSRFRAAIDSDTKSSRNYVHLRFFFSIFGHKTVFMRSEHFKIRWKCAHRTSHVYFI